MVAGGGSYEAVVIGSGYGGSVAAFRLAEASVNVCLLEKGRRWEAQDFPSSVWQTLQTTRLHTPWGVFGNSNSLYQVHYQGTVIALVAGGLGGGSLINGGVVLPTPARTWRDPRWPQEWKETLWDRAEERARSMLQAEAAPSHGFHQDRVVDAVSGEIEDRSRDCVKLSIRFSRGTDPTSSTPFNACNGCGNCFTGCPYNAKNSIDKNYIAAASKSGCTIITNCEAQFLLPNFDYPHTTSTDSKSEKPSKCECDGHQIQRRWRIYLDETHYITADFVIVAAGVLGTTKLLLQSKIRGLAISDRLGHGFSCNGNNAAFVCGTHLATKGHSLTPKELKNTPMFDRPGPSITASYTSSLGYTIQGAILPNAFPFVFLKCIAHRGFWFGLLYGLWHNVKRLLGARNNDSLIFNMMGHDAADGRIEFDLDRGLTKFFPPTDPLIPKKISTVERITKRIGGQMFMPTSRNSAVHLLGGCPAGRTAGESVTNSNGQLFHPLVHSNSSLPYLLAAGVEKNENVHDGLYVCDASIIPCAVGVNPSFTITTAAEYVAEALVKDAVDYYKSTDDQPASLVQTSDEMIKSDATLSGRNIPELKRLAGARVWETLSGTVEGLPCTLEVVMDIGSAESRHGILKGRLGGKFKMRALETGLLHIVDGTVDMCVVNTRTPFSQYMYYKLLLVSERGAMYDMIGRKEMKPFLLGATALTESRTLELEISQVSQNFNLGSLSESKKASIMRGTVRVSYLALLRSVLSMRGPRKCCFVSSLLLSILCTYFGPTLRSRPSSEVSYVESPDYPQHLEHIIATDDGAQISCWQWLPTANQTMDNALNSGTSTCVLLLNGYSGESYTLPTEDDDLVRTLLNKGYEVWLLRMRLHFSVCTANPFSLDDIARFDLPAAFSGIAAVRGKQTPIHVVAHCIGGLTIHMALLGGYVPVSSVASLTCTNSSMFFDVTKLAVVKLFLPLIPISLKLLGANSVLGFSDSPSENWRHRLLKKFLCLIPRVEHCTCKECDLFSGIFGNAFWHENLTERLHAWLSKDTLVQLPASGFCQLRQICMAGNVVSNRGEDLYMPYIGCLALPTTYISGGRPLLVTPTTSERAHALMQHHHPEFRHVRHVVHGYGHSDLLIAERAPQDVFPLILDGISKSGRLADSGSVSVQSTDVRRRTWVIPPSQATAFLLRLKICVAIFILVIFLCCSW
ncbi:hypothetical protein GOP47_0023611 [Adiantum capillus-veneris]|uniref:4Fe-4S ferredoxin-type domain-containing protein n=1 Tax=Adiantum capillus-veneris TaxID=13818 RepID=A0A9D4Z633_ADICA|nr:hypothetical protein GOP47_0023611 [Adiantum capillus-veneris]